MNKNDIHFLRQSWLGNYQSLNLIIKYEDFNFLRAVPCKNVKVNKKPAVYLELVLNDEKIYQITDNYPTNEGNKLVDGINFQIEKRKARMKM